MRKIKPGRCIPQEKRGEKSARNIIAAALAHVVMSIWIVTQKILVGNGEKSRRRALAYSASPFDFCCILCNHMDMARCSWVGNDPLLIDYHDREWGVPLHDDTRQFEFLCMEVMQCGLSWMTVLRKRDAMRLAFDAFDPKIVSSYGEPDIQRIMDVPQMIRSERKIRAIINNAKVFLSIQQEFGTFSEYLWGFTGNRTIEYPGHADGSIQVASNELSDTISKDLKHRGCSYLGSITIYSHLQAAGLINDHYSYCDQYHRS